MSKSRVSADVLAAGGFGFPKSLSMRLAGAFVANATGPTGVLLPTNLAPARSGAKAGSVFTLSHASIWAGTVGDRTTGTYTIKIVKTDSTGAVNLGVLATIPVPAAAGPQLIDLRDSQKRGIKLKVGDCLRIDTGAAASGGATNAADFAITIIGEAYGIAC